MLKKIIHRSVRGNHKSAELHCPKSVRCVEFNADFSKVIFPVY